jgi:sulfhydrogenase subunit beta (sulfur reductase)
MSGVPRTGNGPREPYTIAKGDLSRWVERLLARGEVVAPTGAESEVVAFTAIRDPGEVRWEFENSLLPPKSVVFPQTDPLMTVFVDHGRHRITPANGSGRRTILALRSCDTHALAYLRRVFAADLPDHASLRRLDALTVITLACTRPCDSGFCVCCSAGPHASEGFDLQLTDLGGRMLAEVGSERGSALLAEAGSLFSAATASEISGRAAAEERARASFGEETCHFASAMRRISTGRVPEELWEAASVECFECGGCTLACPTCTCFSVRDRPNGDGWERCRVGDSCQYAAFTLEASGHNPRQQHGGRMRRRFFHKVSAQYFQRDGSVGCVGCGRCVRVCLGTTDMPAVVAAVRRGVWHG